MERLCIECPFCKRDWTNPDNPDRYCCNGSSNLYGENVDNIVKCDYFDGEKGYVQNSKA